MLPCRRTGLLLCCSKRELAAPVLPRERAGLLLRCSERESGLEVPVPAFVLRLNRFI